MPIHLPPPPPLSPQDPNRPNNLASTIQNVLAGRMRPFPEGVSEGCRRLVGSLLQVKPLLRRTLHVSHALVHVQVKPVLRRMLHASGSNKRACASCACVLCGAWPGLVSRRGASSRLAQQQHTCGSGPTGAI